MQPTSRPPLSAGPRLGGPAARHAASAHTSAPPRDDTGSGRGRAPRRQTWSLVAPSPLLVVLLGVAVATLVALVGLRAIVQQAEQSAAASADLLATTLAARVLGLAPEPRHEVVARAARRSGASIWLLSSDGYIVEDASAAPIDFDGAELLHNATGTLTTNLGAWRYSTSESTARPTNDGSSTRAIVPHAGRLFVVAAMEIPAPPEGERALVGGLVTLTALLTAVASAVAFAVSRDVRRDVEVLTARIREIASRGRETTDRAQDTLPVHALDEVGELAVAFNGLVQRFAVAEKTYADALARMEEIDRERSVFLATVSHELRSPLNAILGFADILLSEVDGPLVAESREEVAVIKQSGLHLLGLINDILELSAIASGQLKLQCAQSDIVAIAEEVVREAKGTRGDKPVVLRVVSREASCMAYVDPRRVRQILQNLVGNAVKFTPKGEVLVAIEAGAPTGERRDPRWVTVQVRDTGPGIPREERDAIFDEFRQGGDKRTRRRGTGLGLAIARRLAVMHGGSIRLESEVGVGSTFVLKLPARARSADRSGDRSGAREGRPTKRSDPPPSDPRGRAATLPSITDDVGAEDAGSDDAGTRDSGSDRSGGST